MADLFGSILVLYNWIVAGVLVFFLFLIGRFYERQFGQRSYHQLFLLPMVYLIVGGVWDAFFANSQTGIPLLDFVGEPGPDLLLLIGGLTLIGLSYTLYRTMMGGRQ